MPKVIVNEIEHFFVEMGPVAAEDDSHREEALARARKYRANAEFENRTLVISETGYHRWTYAFNAVVRTYEQERDFLTPPPAGQDLPCVVCARMTFAYADGPCGPDKKPLCEDCERRSAIWLARKAREES